MGLCHWGGARGKWILYRSQAQHSFDCEQHPFEATPRRVLLDTNVVNLMVKYSEQVFEQAWLPNGLDSTRAHDVEALMHVFHIGGRAPWEIVASRKMLSEIGETPDLVVRDRLLAYACELVDPPTDDVVYAASLGRRLFDAPFTAALPDPADRELIGNAIGLGCDVFCTCDKRTVVRKREHLRQLPIRILTPAEWWAHIKPWAALWG
jgi:hypothetical protein